MKNEEKRNILLEAAKKIKSFGYRVFVVDDPGNNGRGWGYFQNDKTVAYFQCDDFGFISIGTRHRGTTGFGTGFLVEQELLIAEITKDICEEALGMYPKWYRGSLEKIVKYTPEQFFKTEQERWSRTYTEI